MMSIGIYGVSNLSTVNSSLETVYKDRVVPLKQLKVISDMYAINIVDATHKMRNGNIDFKEGKRNIKKARELSEANWITYKSTYLTPAEKQLAMQVQEMMQASNESIEGLQVIIDNQDMAALTNFTIKDLYPQIDPITGKISELIDLQLAIADQEYLKGAAIYSKVRINSLLLIALGIALSLTISVIIVKSIRKAINTASLVVSKAFLKATYQ
jgi:hypothetical protein